MIANDYQGVFKRYEIKYLLTAEQLGALSGLLSEYFEADGYGKYTVSNLYYDTPDFALIRASLEKPVYKEKLRLRSYGVPAPDGAAFVELKKKFRGVVYKRRVRMSPSAGMYYLAGTRSAPDPCQITREIDYFQHIYGTTAPRVYIAYDREAYIGVKDECKGVRVTFDRAIRWRTTALDLTKGDHGALLLPNDRILMELKVAGATPLPVARAMSEIGAFHTTFSKYGRCYIDGILPSQKLFTIGGEHIA